MATKPRIPNATVPFVDVATGLVTPEWYGALAQFAQPGEFSLTVGAAGAAAALPATPAGYFTVYVSSLGKLVPRLVPFYAQP